MKLSTGKVRFLIEFDNGDTAAIYFNPNDRGMQGRLQKFENSVESKIKAIDMERYNANNDTANNFNIDLANIENLLDLPLDELKKIQEKAESLSSFERECNKAVKEELDVVFDSKISDSVFRYCQPFDIIVVEDKNGKETREMYIIHFMRWLANELKKHGVENKSAMDKHLVKYGK